MTVINFNIILMFYFIIFIISIFGLSIGSIGSFINCLVWRLHERKTLLGRSICPKCGYQLSWSDNIPLFSFLFLRGKCRKCGEKISWQYPVVELTTAVLFVLAFNIQYSIFNTHSITNIQYSINDLIFLLRNWFLISVMIIIFIYDLKYYLILDIISLPSILIMFIFNFFLGFNLLNLLISGIIGGSFFLFQFLISKGKWLGGGDIRLGLLMGVSLAWPMSIFAIFLAYILGSFISVPLLIFKKKSLKSEIPLGVFLAPATIITLFWGEVILNWYLNLLVF